MAYIPVYRSTYGSRQDNTQTGVPGSHRIATQDAPIGNVPALNPGAEYVPVSHPIKEEVVTLKQEAPIGNVPAFNPGPVSHPIKEEVVTLKQEAPIGNVRALNPGAESVPVWHPIKEEAVTLKQEADVKLEDVGVPLQQPNIPLQHPVAQQQKLAAPIPHETLLLQQQAAFKAWDHLEYTMDGPEPASGALVDATSNK